jgi:virginiamycin B lyase
MRHGLRLARVTLAPLGLAAVQAASADAYVYWTLGTTAIGRANLDGNGVAHAFIRLNQIPGWIAVDGGHICWTNALTSSIGRANIDGTGADPTWIPLGAGVIARGLAVDASHVYWTTGTTIGRANLDGSGINPAFIPGLDEPSGLAIDSGTIYFGQLGGILTEPVNGVGTPVVLASVTANSLPGALAVSGGYVYWASLDQVDGSTIARVQTNGSGLDTSFIAGLQTPLGVAVDGTYLYWTDAGGGKNQIGRAPLAAPGAATYDFITEPDGPGAVAVDARVDPTTTSVSCLQSSVTVSTTTTCTAKVSDSASSAGATGTVNFTAGNTAIVLGSPCTLGVIGGVAQCTIGVEPTVAGHLTIGGSYGGDSTHSASAGNTSLCAGPSSLCNPPPPKLACAVPKLKGKTLAQARGLLTKAHCALGKVTKPKTRKHHKLGQLVVGSTKPAGGSKLANNSKVAVTLVAAPKRRRR